MTVIECRAYLNVRQPLRRLHLLFRFYYYELLVNFNQLVSMELMEYLVTDSSEQVF